MKERSGLKLQPTLWRTCRILANKVRLRMMRELFHAPGQIVTTLAKRLNISLPLASTYLRMLNARGLLAVKRKGKLVYYTPIADSTIPWTGDLLKALHHELYSSDKGVARAFYKLTGFTHSRRVDICRILQSQGALSIKDIQIGCGISRPALMRHLKKLTDRNVLVNKNGRYKCRKRGDRMTMALLAIAGTQSIRK